MKVASLVVTMGFWSVVLLVVVWADGRVAWWVVPSVVSRAYSWVGAWVVWRV